MWMSLGRKPWVKRANKAGKVFFWARSPLAPRTTTTVSSVSASPEVSIDGMDPFLDEGEDMAVWSVGANRDVDRCEGKKGAEWDDAVTSRWIRRRAASGRATWSACVRRANGRVLMPAHPIMTYDFKRAIIWGFYSVKGVCVACVLSCTGV